MAAPKKARNLNLLWQQGMQNASKLNAWTHGWLGLIGGAVKQVLKFDSGIMAAAMAYFALFSLFPLILLAISIASLNLGLLIDQQLIIDRLEFIAPALGRLLGQSIDEIIRARGPVSGVALIGLVWASSNILHMLTQTLNFIWGRTRRRSVWKQRGLSILLVLAFAGPVLFLASFAGSLFSNIRSWLPEQATQFWGTASFFAAVLLDIAFFMMLYMIFPHGGATWREILPGAIGAGLLWELAKKGFLLFISTYISTSNLVYGSVAAIIAFLTWAHLSSLILLFGAFLSVAYYQFKQSLLPKEVVSPD